MNVLRLSDLRTGRLYPTGNIPGTLICYRLSRPEGHSVVGRNKSMKNPMTPSRIEPALAQCFNQLLLCVYVCVFVCVKFTNWYQIFHFYCLFSPSDAPWKPSRIHTITAP